MLNDAHLAKAYQARGHEFRITGVMPSQVPSGVMDDQPGVGD
jgi:hypothetical protein